MNKLRREDILPNTLHGLLKVAIEDVKKAMKNKHIKLDMDEWQTTIKNFKNKDIKCVCCMAGAVMIHRLNTNINKEYCPNYFTKKIQNKLYAIDSLRKFNFTEAYFYLYGREDKHLDAHNNKPKLNSLKQLRREFLDFISALTSQFNDLSAYDVVLFPQKHLNFYSKFQNWLKLEGV